jgi:hypothetical protein
MAAGLAAAGRTEAGPRIRLVRVMTLVQALPTIPVRVRRMTQGVVTTRPVQAATRAVGKGENMTTFTTKDSILPMIKLEPEVEITITMDRKNVYLQIGPRDWAWDRETKQRHSCGTDLGAFSGKDVEFWKPEDLKKVLQG